jgi:hypothetical protein
MKKISLLLILLLTCSLNFGQIKDSTNYFVVPSNSIYYEFLGITPLYSINYERIVYNRNKFYFSGRIGCNFLYFETESNYGTFFQFSAPISFNLFIRRSEKKNFEIGSGLGYIYCPYIFQKVNGSSKGGICPSMTMAGRYQNRKGFIFRFAFTPFMIINYCEHHYDAIFLPLFGITIGGGFGR